MSSDRARNVSDMFGRTLVFNTANAADYATIAEAATQFATVQSAADALDGFFATQTSGDASMAVEQKSVLRAAIRRKIKAYSRTARALKSDIPGIEKVFSAPDSNNDTTLIAKGRDIVTEAGVHHVALAGLGLAASMATDLTADLDALEAANDAKTAGNVETVGATAGIDNEVDEGMEAEIKLDAIMHNVYRDNPVKLAAWTTARHVQRAPKHAPPTPPPPGP